MKNNIPTLCALAVCLAPCSYGFGGFGANIASERTQLANNVLAGSQLAKQAAIYAKQIEEYKTQLEQFDLEKIAAKVFDTGQFDSTLEKLDEYRSVFDLDDSKVKLGDLQNYSDLVSAGGSQDAEQYLAKLGEATDRKLELSKAQSELVTKRMDSVATDRVSLQKMQEANAGAEGEMQAAQIGNHINSEMVGQLIKMRQEQAAESQIQAEKDALTESLQAQEEAKKLALLKADAAAAEQRRNRPEINGEWKGLNGN